MEPAALEQKCFALIYDIASLTAHASWLCLKWTVVKCFLLFGINIRSLSKNLLHNWNFFFGRMKVCLRIWKGSAKNMLGCLGWRSSAKVCKALCTLRVQASTEHYTLLIQGFMLPVLKHGPRSLTCVQVSEFTLQCEMKVTAVTFATASNQSIMRGLSVSISVRTRKMVNYAWEGQAQGKLWWRLAAILTCKSFVIHGYRGERLIEPSSSWFPPKFPSG